jgi:ferrous iron transport protein B
MRSLLINGVVAGVGGVLVFLPQIILLFFFIAVLEDCGYMARAAYLMDKLMSRVGLSGKSFIPLLSSFACAIPGIMAARVIENPKDRLITILVAPLMSCSARLPVYTLLIGAFIPPRRLLGGLVGLQGLTMLSLYGIGIVAAAVVALILRKTLVRGRTPPFVMELPSYKLPEPGIVVHRMFDRGFAFVRRAGTVIFAVTILIWAAGYYPRSASAIDAALLAEQGRLRLALSQAQPDQRGSLEDRLAGIDNQIEGQYLRESYLGKAGRVVEPLVRPLGWDWRIGCAVIASFPAREVVIATLGVIYNLGTESREEPLRDTLRRATWDRTGLPVFTVPVALSLMVFFALCAQCASTLAVMYRETNGWRWPAFTFVYMTALAYVGALLTYQLGSRLM